MGSPAYAARDLKMMAESVVTEGVRELLCYETQRILKNEGQEKVRLVS